MKYLIILLLSSSFSIYASADFKQTFDQELKYDNTYLSEELLEKVESYHFVFIGGFLNEALVGYFDSNKRVLKQLHGSFSEIYPSSLNSAFLNAAILKNEIINISNRVKKPLVIIAHSKGGFESLIMNMVYPELTFSGIIKANVLVQSALRGSPSASVICALSPNLLSKWNGLFSMKPESTQEINKRLIKGFSRLSLQKQKTLSNSIFYIRSSINSDKPAKSVLASHIVLGRFPNDGILVTHDQKLSYIGTDLGILDGDHADFVAEYPFSNSTRKFKEAFTRALLIEVL